MVCHGDFEEYMEESPSLYCYRRFTDEGELVVCCNFTKEEQEWDESIAPEGAEILIGNYEEHQRGCMKAYEAIVYQKLSSKNPIYFGMKGVKGII